MVVITRPTVDSDDAMWVISQALLDGQIRPDLGGLWLSPTWHHYQNLFRCWQNKFRTSSPANFRITNYDVYDN